MSMKHKAVDQANVLTYDIIEASLRKARLTLHDENIEGKVYEQAICFACVPSRPEKKKKQNKTKCLNLQRAIIYILN